jgi:hypothetical protein
VTALAPGDLSVEVADAEGEGPAERFRLIVKDAGKDVESFDVTAKKGGRNYVVTQVKERSKLIAVAETAPAAQLARPDNQTVALTAPAAAPAAPPYPAREVTPRHIPARPPTSATPPTAPASAVWRPWTRSPWSRCPT